MTSPKVTLVGVLEDLSKEAFEKFKWYLKETGDLEGVGKIKKSPWRKLEEANEMGTADLMVESYCIYTIKVAMQVLRNIGQKLQAEELSKLPCDPEEILADCQKNLKNRLKERFQYLLVKITDAGNEYTFLNEIYTELFITVEEKREVRLQHEALQLEKHRNPAGTRTTVKCEDIFKGSPGRGEPIRRVLTKGVAGIGKTVLTQKFTLDWAEDKANQDIHFTFPFTFRELNVLKKKFSLVELVHHFFTETKEAGICSFDRFQVLFIFDGLDECRLPLDFHNTEILTDVTESTSVDVLLTNLIRGKLLPSAHLWITTRPAAANQIPSDFAHRVTEVKGFSDPQKEKYFQRRFKDEEQASRIISHIKTSRSLHIMCHIPVFCWITATVLEDEMKTRNRGELSKNLTEMYIHFLVVQAKVKKVKYEGGTETDPHWSPDSRKMIYSLGKLAFEQLQKGNMIFYESDLTECGIDIREASMYSGVFTKVFKVERCLYKVEVFCFIHLSVQEFLAALHVHLTFINSGVNLLGEKQNTSHKSETSDTANFYQSAVDMALQSPNGHLDLFLRFLLGLSLETNNNPLHNLLNRKPHSSNANEKAAKYIKKKIDETLSVERSINLFHCLNELNDHSLVEEIKQSLTSGHLKRKRNLSPAEYATLAFILLSSEKDLEEFDLRKCHASEEALLWLIPVIKVTKKALLNSCELSERSCEALSSVLSSPSSSVKHLDLSNNELKDSGVKTLCVGLKSPHCRLKTLRLSSCLVSEEGCEALSTVLCFQFSSLRNLVLTDNNLKYSGMKKLSVGLQSPHCKLQTLSLSRCLVSEEGGDALFSVLSFQFSSLKHLDLSNNNLKDLVMKSLSVGLQSPHCRLSGEDTDLSRCQVTEEGYKALSSALSYQSSSLRVLDLTDNNLKDSGVKILSVGLQSRHCKLQTLSLSGCLVSGEGCSSLVSALRSSPSHLRNLDLSYNHPGESGVKILSALQEDPRFRLDTLRVDHGGEQRLKPGLRKYFCQPELDTNSVNRNLELSDNNRKVTLVETEQNYPDHPDRFDFWKQLLCRNGLTGRCYWEVERRGLVWISVSYRGIRRKGHSVDCWFGGNNQSWSLFCHDHGYSVHHNKISTSISSWSVSTRVGVYVDCPAGILSFYSVSSDSLIHLHTFNTTFTEPLYPGFWFWFGSSVSL
ncbi:NACHT, LRR and PYD domains-containing protein 3-like [Pholidichthys leucotaenia]